MKVLVIGGGGREHTLAWKLAQSPKITQLYSAPGNPGMAAISECVPIGVDAIDELIAFAKQGQIDWTVVGPENPLCDGLVDRFQAEGLKAYGPRQAPAQLEGSKIFSKRFMAEHNIPTAPFDVFQNATDTKNYIEQRGLPQVIKADGLAAGKGVFVCFSQEDVDEALNEIFEKKSFGDAGLEVIVEDCLEGIEASFLVFADGDHALPLAPAQDHKPIFEGNKGPNTGGMGTFCPTTTLSAALQQEVINTVVQPVLDGMKAKGTPFKGILYTGLMLTQDGPLVLEFNVRFGDPEAQVILPRLNTDLIDIFEATEQGTLNQLPLSWDEREALCVIMASGGYPGSYEKGQVISGLDQVGEDVIIFHAGTKQDGGNIVTNGGRVLGVTALAATREDARRQAYTAVEKISWNGAYYRKDIGIN